MAQVVEADARQSVLFQHFREAFADIVGTDEIAERIDADHVEVFLCVIPTVKAAVSILQFPVFPQDIFHLRQERKRTLGGFGFHFIGDNGL